MGAINFAPFFCGVFSMEEQQDLFSEIMPPAKPKHVERLQQVQEGLPARLFLGTTSWSNEDWEDLVYPEGCAAADYIEHYAKVFKGSRSTPPGTAYRRRRRSGAG